MQTDAIQAPRPNLIDWVLWPLCTAGLVAFVYLSSTYPAVLPEQGLAHRIFYFHVGVAWGALYGPILMAVYAFLYLRRGNPRYDELGVAAGWISIVFCLGVLFSGPIWAQSAWGRAWDWNDLRLQTFFVLFLMLCGYMLLRAFTDDPNRKAKVAAVFSLIIAANAVLVWFAIRVFQTKTSSHPGSVLKKGGLDSEQKTTMFFGALVFSLLFVLLFRIARRWIFYSNRLHERRSAHD